MKQALIYSQENCQACNQALSLLAAAGYETEVLKLDHKPGNKRKLMEDFPNARSVPQCIVDGQKIGGLVDLKKYIAVGEWLK